MAAFEENSFTSGDGLRICYREFGKGNGGVPILCLPGISRNSRDFEDICDYLADRYHVFAMDFRGRGYSDHDPNWRNYHPQTYADDVHTFLDDRDIGRIILLGTSLGGLVSTILSAQHPGRVAAVILNDVGPEIGPAGLARIKNYIGRLPPVGNWDEAVAQAKEINGIAWPNLPEEKWQRIARRLYREDKAGVPQIDMDPMVGEAARKIGATLTDPWVLFDGLRGIPTLLLHGELSDILTDEIVERMLARKPDLVHVVVPDCGHVPLLDEPASISAIDSFLSEVQRSH